MRPLEEQQPEETTDKLDLSEVVGLFALRQIIERTETAQQEFDSIGMYITNEW